MKQVLTTLTILASVLLAACNGQNPTNRESNPLKGYEGLSNDKPATEVPPAPIQEPRPSQSLCSRIFDIGIDGARGRLLKFDAGQPGKILLSARWYRPGARYSLKLEGAPAGMSLQCASKGCGQAEISHWTIWWTPSLNLIQDNTSFDTIVTIRFSTSDKDTLKKCGSDFSEDFNVQVQAKVRRPVATVVGLPKEKVQFGETVKFNIVVSNADNKNQPQIMFGINEDAVTGEINYLDAQAAVGCSSAQLKGDDWVFDCEWASDKIQDAKKFIDQDITRPSRFDVVVTSKGISSTQVPGLLNVYFPAAIAKDEKASPTPITGQEKTVAPEDKTSDLNGAMENPPQEVTPKEKAPTVKPKPKKTTPRKK